VKYLKKYPGRISCSASHLSRAQQRHAAHKEPAVLAGILLALPAIPAVTLILPPFVPVLMAAGTLVAAMPILIQILKAAGPGAVGDLVGAVFNRHPELTAHVVRELTSAMQPLGARTDIAHRLMAPGTKASARLAALHSSSRSTPPISHTCNSSTLRTLAL